jgi:hypothetical protein
MEVSGLLHNPATLLMEKNLVPIQNEAGQFEEEKNFFFLLGFIHSVCSLFIIPYRYSVKLKLYVNRLNTMEE